MASAVPWPPSVVRSVRVQTHNAHTKPDAHKDKKPLDLGEIMNRLKSLLQRRHELEETLAQPMAVVKMSKGVYDKCLLYRTRSYCDQLASTQAHNVYGFDFLNNYANTGSSSVEDPYRSVDF